MSINSNCVHKSAHKTPNQINQRKNWQKYVTLNDSNLYIYLALILLIVMCITGFIMYKWQIKLIYWLSLNLIISPVLSFALIQLDTSIFDTPFGSTGEGLIPIFSVVCSIILQVSIWLFIKLHKWICYVHTPVQAG